VKHEIRVTSTNADELWLWCSCGWDEVLGEDVLSAPLAELNSAAQAHLDEQED
jgi:hypothetical protein